MSTQTSLYESPAVAVTGPDGERVSLMDLLCQKRTGIAGWRGCNFESLDDNTMIVKGAVYAEVYKSGKRKGSTNYGKPTHGTEKTIAIEPGGLHAFKVEWESATGKCHVCTGTKAEWTGWSAANGNRFRVCKRCNGTGAAPQVKP